MISTHNCPITLLSPQEMDKMRRAGRFAANMLAHLGKLIKPGITTLHLNEAAEQFAQQHGARNGPLGYHGFPKSICTSINNVVCHGIPSAKDVLQEGDIIAVDVTPVVDGYHGDTCKTFCVGQVSAAMQQLVRVTQECLQLAIAEVAPGKRIGDIGAAIVQHAQQFSYGVVRDFCGHGVGRQLHAEPQIPHVGKRGRGLRLQAGMAFTIEPMINMGGDWRVDVLNDGWTAVTRDGQPSAQFEHTLLVTQTGVEVLTASATNS